MSTQRQTQWLIGASDCLLAQLWHSDEALAGDMHKLRAATRVSVHLTREARQEEVLDPNLPSLVGLKVAD